VRKTLWSSSGGTSTPEAQREGSFFMLPVVKDVEDVFEGDPVMASIVVARNNAAYFQLYDDQVMPPAVGEAINDAVETLFAGVATPEKAAAF
jgi:raffinose/stachyose/melibiose transport system substrate-binding protein